MAGSKSQTKKPKRKTNGKAGDGIKLSVAPRYESAFSTYYSNFAAISHTPDELCIDFCLIAPPHVVDAETTTLRPDVVARVMVPPRIVDGLIKALRSQIDKQKVTAKTGELTIPLEKK